MISVIIPVLNEEATIASVVQFASQCPNVSEVIVVDDKSIDNTVNEAIAAGAKVITSTRLGKGASMKDGLLVSMNEIIVYLDGDINPYPAKTIELLTAPLLNDEADFCKATFSRQAGRVTELVAKPLLSILFPELTIFQQPLSGMIAAKKKLLKDIEFKDDYGVDIGILIDVFLLNARITEVNIGDIENKMKPWNELGKMSREVSQAIISKSLKHPDKLFTLEDVNTIQIIRDQMNFAIKESIKNYKKMVVFDMDNTILKGRFIDTCAKFYGFSDKLMEIRSSDDESYVRIKKIANLLKGLNISQLIAVADSIQIVEDCQQVVSVLKDKGYIVGIISDSYDTITNYIKNKIKADFSLSNELEFSNSIATGEVKVPSFFFHNDKSICRHNLCKINALISVLNKYQISINNVIAIGDSENDLCMIKNVGIGVSFCSKNDLLNYNADKIIDQYSFQSILDFAK